MVPAASASARVIAIAAAVCLLGGGRPAAQRRVEAQDTNTPFAFTMNRYAEPFDRSPRDEWLEAVLQHTAGDADAAARRIGAWEQNHLAHAVMAFHAAPARLLAHEKLDLTRRAVVLHTDIAVLACQPAADRFSTQFNASLHFGVAFNLVDYLRRAHPTDAFILSWYRAVSTFLIAAGEIVSSPILLDRGLALFPSNAELLALAGAVRERLASPRVQDASDVDSEIRRVVGSVEANLDRAEGFYRKALKADPAALEVRVHLGRTLMLRQRYDDAAAELRAVLGRAPDSLRFLAYLFLGQTEAARGRREPARAAFERALELRPSARSAHLALSHLERSHADRHRAVAALRSWLDEAGDDTTEAADPWNTYFDVGPSHRSAEVLDEFRTPFRRQP